MEPRGAFSKARCSMSDPRPLHPGRRVRAAVAALLASCLAAFGTVAHGANPASDAPEGPRPGRRVQGCRHLLARPAAVAKPRGRQRVDRREVRLRHGPRAAAVGEPAEQDRHAADPPACRVLRRTLGHLRRPQPIRGRDPAPDRPGPEAGLPDDRVRARHRRRQHPAAALAGHVHARGQALLLRRLEAARHIAGPYASTQDFVAEYSAYRNRPIVAFRELESYQRKQRTMAVR